MTLYEELKARGLVAQITDEEIIDLINNGKATFYIGFDCTADSLTAGHFMALTLMKRLQMAGNKPIALIGGGTTMIGDPSGRTDMRKMLTKEDIAHNAACFKKQMEKFIDFSEGKALMLNNADWLLNLNYVELLRDVGACFSVNNMLRVVGSSIARATDSGAYIHVGPEIGVASTKAFTGQVTVMAMLALAVGRERGTVAEAYYNEVSAALLRLPGTMEEVLKVAPQVADLAKIFTYAHNFIYLGRGYNYPTALEGALKLKEISYIHAEGYPAAEMKHGPIALIDAEMPTVAIATPDHTYEKTASNIEEIKARGGKIIAVIARGDEQVRRSADFVIEVPVIAECLMPIVVSVPLQLLAYYIAVYKGRNVDQPRNLAKSVTVE